MRLSVVRCPFCDRRYNVTGIPSGTRVLCTSCQSVLTVPRSTLSASGSLWRRWIPQSAAAQVAFALVGGLFLAWGGYLAVRGPQEPRREGEAVVALPKVPITGASVSEPGHNIWLRIPPDLHDTEKFERRWAKPFLLVGEKHPQVFLSAVFDKYAELLEKLYHTFMKEFGESLRLENIDAILTIVLYTRKESYEAWWKDAFGRSPGRVPGVYSYDQQRVGLHYDRELNTGSITSKETLFHEAIHMIVHHYYQKRVNEDRPQPWWFQEGLGGYFEGIRQTPRGEIVPDPKVTTSRLVALKDLERTWWANFIPLQKLMSWTVEDIWKGWHNGLPELEEARLMAQLQNGYAESWALVHFLCQGEGGLYREFFHEYFKLELSGQGSKDSFVELLRKKHRMELSDLEEKFKDYVRTLELE
ncbi:MAG: hypothetical protein HY716_11865 [Planctomycetes bacterium]|nr:hypothetical protein [Planctomycetota bacterium]